VDDRFNLFSFMAADSTIASFGVRRTGGSDLWYINSNVGFWFAFSGPALDQWYCVEAYVHVDASDGVFALYIDGTPVLELTGLNTASEGSAVTAVRTGLVYVTGVTQNIDVYGDCFVIADDYIGEESEIVQYQLTVNVVGSGTTVPAAGTHLYDAGTVVNLTATADAGWTFSGWSGDLGGSENPTTILMDGNKTVTATFLRTSGYFDFGTGASPVESGYIGVSESTLYSGLVGYGWTSTAGLWSRDRGSPDDLRRDLVFGSIDRTFSVDLANGDYQIILIVGDYGFMHDLIDVYGEGVLVVNDLSVGAGTFTEVAFTITVSDGQLNLLFHDDGGADANWVINAIVVRPPPSTDSLSFDFGTGASLVEPGYTAVSESTLYSAFVGYGWTSTTGLGSRDRGLPDDLRCDLVFSGTDRTFNVDLANGDYQVILVIGDQSYLHDLIDVYAEGVLAVNDLSAAGGTFAEVAFIVTVSDGQLNLLFHDDGGADANWVVNALLVGPPPPTSAQFDFGTGASPVAANYTAVSESTLYSAFAGYGWTSTAGLSSRDRGAPDALRQDLVFASVDQTFNVDLANGNYTVTVIIGDQSYLHDSIDIYAEGILKANNVYAAAGTFMEVTFTVTVSDGQLNLLFHDDGGTDANWVINALSVEPAP
jgi:uncharacterized repeat protein (TIGR02543 family)